MTFHAMTEHYEEITVCGKPALFTSIRIRRDTIQDGLYAYDTRFPNFCKITVQQRFMFQKTMLHSKQKILIIMKNLICSSVKLFQFC